MAFAFVSRLVDNGAHLKPHWRRILTYQRCFTQLTDPAARGPRTLKLVLANFSAMNADLLRMAFAGQETIQVLGNALDRADLEVLLEQKANVALIASNGSGKESTALPFLEQVMHSVFPVRSVVISEDMEQEDIIAFFYRGARGLVDKARTDFAHLTKCIHCVSAGQVWASSTQLEQLLCSLGEPRTLRVTNPTGEALLSQREEQVLHLLSRGLSNRELARMLNLSEHTIKNHLFRIFDKLGVSNRMEAVLCVISRDEQSATAKPRQNAARLGTGAA